MRATPFPIMAAILSFALAGPTAQETDDAADSPHLPLEPARTLSLDTDEGTWISVDVSPDGGTIVFDLLGDLYTIPFAGGDATPLTEGMAYDSQPRYSPDGSQVLFVSDRDGSENLWLMDVDSRATRQVTNAPANNYESPEWLPDGDYVVAAVGAGALAGGDRRNPKLWMWHVDGGTGIQLIDEPGSRRITGPAPTPDGRHIWFAQRERLWQYNAIFPQYQLAVYDRETGEQYVRTSRYGSALRPTLSPDGAWLVYGTRHEDRTGLRLRELASGDERWLAYPVQRDDQESVAGADTLPGMSFTPDSSELVVSYGGRIWRVPTAGGAEPIAVPFRVRTELEIGPELAFKYPVDDSVRFTVRQIRDAVPSPDGRTLAFAALDRLHVRPIPDGEPRRLTELDMVEAQPAWSPDGAWIAFVTWSPDGGHLYKVRADGSAPPVRLSTRPAIFQRPAWSPDGERLVAIQGPARSFREAPRQTAPGASANIVSIPADGGDWTLVAPADGRGFPHTTTDPDRIFLYHREDGLVSIRWDGTDEKAHLKVNGPAPPGGGDPQPASLVLMAPAGDRALAQVRLDLHTLAVPYVGGDTPVVSVANPERASVPVRKLTDVGGQFPAWSADGRRAHWSIGNSHFIYDLDDAAAAAEAARAADAAEAEEEAPADAIDDAPAYEPVEIRVAVDAIRDIPNGYGVLRGGRVVTMRGNEVLENADVVVQGNRILGIGRRGSVEFPDFARIIEVPGTTIVPGFVDTHAHMRPSFGVHKTQPWTYLANLAYGVTTTRDPQTGTTDVLTYGDLVETGDIVGPRIYSTGPGVFNAEQIEDLDHAQRVLRRYSEYYDTQTIKMYMSGNRRQRQWIVMAAKEQKLLPTTEGGLDMKYDLEMIIDGYPGLEHSFPIFP
ncbi:MAG: amidohydrolase, partial [Acidobacteriota bacterium]|nr:amidohydrolase [Acidobacteriota bacterium]